VATVAEVASVAGLLDAFNLEYDTPTPGKAVLATRLGRLVAGGDVVALLTGDPAVAVALLTMRPNVWYHGPVALLDELYVAPEVRGRGLGSALLAAAEAVTRQRGGSCSRSTSTRTTPAPAASTSDTATSTASRARISRSSTTTGNLETRRPSARVTATSAGRWLSGQIDLARCVMSGVRVETG